jgi:glutathione S-transferase
MTGPLRLHYAPDNASLCVRLALEEIGVAYDTVLVDRASAEQSSPAYLALNPNGYIPTLETPDGPIFETAAILLWLADRHHALLPPPDSPDRGKALKWLIWLANTVHPALRLHFYPEKHIADDPVLIAALRVRTKQRLGAMFGLLNAARDADWLEAQSSVMACYLAPMLRWCVLYGDERSWFDLSRTPRLLAFARTFETRPAAVRAAAAEGLGRTPFSDPVDAAPPEGSAT